MTDVIYDSSIRSPDPSSLPFTPTRSVYPNPGYLGSSSHVAIFNHISSNGDHETGATSDTAASPCLQLDSDDRLMRLGADALKQLLGTFHPEELTNLVTFWVERGTNLALAGPFVQGCTQTVSELPSSSDGNWNLVYARLLQQNSNRPLQVNNTNVTSFTAQFLQQNVRWETLGIFFSAVCRATIDIPFFPSLYSTEKEQCALRRMATKLSDHALEIALSLDCLNDIQLMLQYENFIVHSYVNGDQSE